MSCPTNGKITFAPGLVLVGHKPILELEAALKADARSDISEEYELDMVVGVVALVDVWFDDDDEPATDDASSITSNRVSFISTSEEGCRVQTAQVNTGY